MQWVVKLAEHFIIVFIGIDQSEARALILYSNGNIRILQFFYLTLGKTFSILVTLETHKIIYLKASAPRSEN